jgi:hypothetical protein
MIYMILFLVGTLIFMIFMIFLFGWTRIFMILMIVYSFFNSAVIS